MVAALASAAPAVADNYSFMKETPYSRFTKEDHKIFQRALSDALDKGADGEARAWSNPSTNASGELTALKTFERARATCRTVLIANKAKGLTASGEYNFCKKSSGKWALSS